MTGFSPAVKAVITERSGGWCERCALRLAVQYHHRRPRGSGGTRRLSTNLAANALHVCRFCHQRIESMRAEAFDYG